MNGGVDHCAGYKEWVAVCEALAEGRQHLLLRKGGIQKSVAMSIFHSIAETFDIKLS